MDEKYGPKMFFEKIHNYLTKYAYSNTVTLDLYNSLRTKDQNVGEFMSTWTDQPGFPYLTFEPVAPNSVSVKQSRFIFSNLVSAIELGAPELEEQVWSIPISYAIYSNSTGSPKLLDRGFTQLDRTEKMVINFEKQYPIDSILLANFKQTGVYRSLYDVKTYHYIIDWLKKDLNILPAVERSGLISDALSMTFSGRLTDPTISLELIKLLNNDTNIFVWKSALEDLNRLKNIFAISSTYGSMVAFQNSIIENIVNSIQWTEKMTDGVNLQGRALLRAKILSEAVRNNHKTSVKKALEYFDMVKQGKKNEIPVSADVMGAIYDAGVIYGDLNDYKFVQKLFLDSTFAPDQQLYLHALASSPIPYLQIKTLNFALSGAVRKQDIQKLIRQVALSTPIGHVTAWIFIKENWTRINEIFQGGGSFGKLSKLLEDITSAFTKQYLISEAERLFIKQADPDFEVPAGARNSVLKGLETAKQFLAWREIYGPQVSYWLECQGF